MIISVITPNQIIITPINDNILEEITNKLIDSPSINPNETLITSKLIYESPTYLYYIFYLIVPKEQDIPRNNQISNIIHDDTIYGNCVMIKTDYNNTHVDITEEEVKYIISFKQTFIGYKITTSNEIIQHNFSTKLNLKELQLNNPYVIKYVLFGWMIKIYLDKNPTNHQLNKIATSIYKQFMIYGDVFICIAKIEQNNVIDYLNLSKTDMLKLINLLIEKDINDEQEFIFDKSFIRSLYTNYSKLTNKQQDIYFDFYIDNLIISREILDGYVLNDHIK